MPKINQEEYEILKNMSADWKWIARDEERLSTYSSTLNVFGNEPSRRNTYWVSGFADIKGVNENLFQFIKWKDEPYNITGLIEEYEFGRILLAMAEEETVLEFESESEETEVKNVEWDIEWIKEQMNRPVHGGRQFNIGYDKAVEKFNALINQLDEPEITIHDAYDKLKEVSPLTEKSFDYYWNAINDGVELDEPEVLSQEWISEKSIDTHVDTVNGEIQVTFILDDLKELLVPKHELPVIPKFVAEWIEHNKESGDIHTATNLNSIHTEIHFKEIYANQSIELQELIARAWLDGFTAEEEQRYYVYLGDGQYLVSEDELKEHYAKIRHEEDIGFSNYVLTFTEQEIKDYDPRYLAFRKLVEELEE